MSSGAGGSGSPRHSARYVAPDFKRRQLLFDSFTKLGAAGGSSQKNISDAAVNHSGASAGGGGSGAGAGQAAAGHGDADVGPKGTLLYTWGAGYHGQLGLNTFRKKCRMMPACIDFREPVLVVACGGFHTTVLTDDGRVYSWGDGRYGQLGNLARKHNMHSTPHLVDWLVAQRISITNLSCGQYHTAAISNQGKLFTWGSGKHGQLGHGVRLDERFPRKVEAERSKMGSFVRVACGDRHTAVVNDSGKVVTFGSGQHGQLGHGNGSDQLRPVMLTDGALASQVVVSIDCGATTTAAVTSTGLFYLWGFGESIHPKGCSNIQDSPRLVKIKEPVKQVACGQAHILVLTDAGDVYAFGEASMGQLGHGSRSNVRNPRLVLRGKEIHQIDAGRYHSMAVSAYGVLYSWGCGESGQLGHNTLDTELFPKIVENILPSVVGQISCGEHHSFSLTSIAHSSVSADVLNWKLIEDEELKLKRAMLHDVPNGLKSKHILQVEQERKGIIRQLAEALKKEREDNGAFAQLQMSLIRQPEELVDDVRQVQEEALNSNDPEAIAQVSAMAQAARKLMLTSESRDHVFNSPPGGGAGSRSLRDNHGNHNEHMFSGLPGESIAPSAAGAHDHEDEDEEGDISDAAGQRVSSATGGSKKGGKSLGSSASAAVLPSVNAAGGQQRGLNNVASSPDLMFEEEAKQQGGGGSSGSKLSKKGGLNSSASQPSLLLQQQHGASSKQLAPLRPSTALSVALQQSQKHKKAHAEQQQQLMSRTEALDDARHAVAPDSPHGEHGIAAAQQLVEFNPNLSALTSSPAGGASSSSSAVNFQPLAPRLAFAEQTVKALTWVKNMVAVNPNSASEVNFNVLRLQKTYNALKASRDSRTTHLESLKAQLALCKPSADEEEGSKASAERIKQLNMRLVTLNTRLMEAEENKRNYELYIIRMKEEDLQLSKQIEHLRQLVTEYDRLLAKVERMSLRVQSQKGEMADELARFQADIASFVSFADTTVSNYRQVLHQNFKKSQRMDSELERKMDSHFDASRSTLSKLETQLSTTDQQAQEHKEKLESWEDKVEYYERRFRKLSNSTGLSRSEQIIAKHYFQAEITSDLKLDIEYKQDTLLALQAQQKQLEQVLAECSAKHTDSRWRDVAQLEEANVNAVNRLLRAKADSELWAQKVTLVEEGLLQLARSVQHTLARKEGLTTEQQAQLVLIGANPVLSVASPGRGSANGGDDLSSPSGGASHLLPAPEKGLRAVDLEKAVEQQLEILMAACAREKVESVARAAAAAEHERTQAQRRREMEESNSAAALELAKTFISPKASGAAQQGAQNTGLTPAVKPRFLDMDDGAQAQIETEQQ